ncbi:MAG: helix-turn-helix domain-containing protein, partial [Thaumarchaeota archaeon]|nr:helix-turn-helix domain-containing protein [Nitrososphaerota archaeon]
NAIVALKSHVNYLERFCNYLKINPEQLTFSKDRQTVKNYMKTFKAMLESGQTSHKPSKLKQDGTPNFDYIFKCYKDSIRSFVAFHGISLPKGEGGVLANKIIGHGKFADIKLTDEELHKADLYLAGKYGRDSDIYLLFWIGVESCARAKALLKMKLDFVEVTSKTGITTFEMVAYESKTKHIADGKWMKYIRRKLTQEAIIRAKERGWTVLYDKSIHKMYEELRDMLKDLYRHLGKTNDYFYEHSVHTLRHVGAHYWLRKTNYNYGIVAKIGGWHIIDELKRSYGEMPADVLFEVLDKTSKGLNEI